MGDIKMKCTLTLFIAVILLQYTAFAADKTPQSVAEIWSENRDFVGHADSSSSARFDNFNGINISNRKDGDWLLQLR